MFGVFFFFFVISYRVKSCSIVQQSISFPPPSIHTLLNRSTSNAQVKARDPNDHPIDILPSAQNSELAL